MEAIILQDLCMWILDMLPPTHRSNVSSLSSALDPVHLLAVLAQVMPAIPDEPDLHSLTSVSRDSDLHNDSVEAMLTIYVNTCRRLGMRCLFAPHTHPALAAASATGGGAPPPARGAATLPR